ncbi:bifunctional serine/threonine-protein kinase/transporter substrate-binding domain-containing protein [Streptomyces sp. NPDC056045]|uniref:bifunctional serine/threonine-protein kinase/transporter substrate-binding domain-containing protein n=1 Tax=Streptomyces sp. NPDC056045 TaxID=3345691 RepID=UPI0035D78C7E
MRPLSKHDPRQIGPFRIVGLLGGGGMGRVYLGHSVDGRAVAVKTARSELADDPGFRTRFAREVAAARRVSGPFVTPVVDAAPHDDVPWMATDYVPGVSLTDAVRDDGPLPGPAARLLTAGLLHALAAVHAQGLVHRDLKPSNILLTAEGPRVIDFGIAYSAAETALTATGTALGTPGYMAPEQLVMSGPEVTGAADVFALGGVIVFAATGGGPYGSADPQILMYRTVHEEPRLDGLPDGLRELAADCLAREPGQRPALPVLMNRAGTPGPYADWLPEPVSVRLRELAGELDHLLSGRTGPAGEVRPAGARGGGARPMDFSPPLPPVPPPGPTGPTELLPSGPAGSPNPADRSGPADAVPTAVVPADAVPTAFVTKGPATPHPNPTPVPSPSPSRRRVLAALAGAGVVAGGGALGWTLWPDGFGGSTGGSRSGGNSGGKSRVAVLPKGIRDKGVITVGSDPTYAPMEYLDTGGRTVGMDIDLGKALGRELGVRFEFESTNFDSLLTGLDAGRFDLVMSAMTDTRDRQQGRTGGTGTGRGVDMIDYFDIGLGLLVRKGNPEGVGGPDDLSGRTVAVERGGLARDYVGEPGRGNPKVREFDTVNELCEDVRAGRSAVGLADFPVLAHAVATRSGGGTLELVGDQLDPAPCGIAVAKSETDLRDAVRDALDRLIANGEYAKILKKWGVAQGAVRRAVVNGGK